MKVENLTTELTEDKGHNNHIGYILQFTNDT